MKLTKLEQLRQQLENLSPYSDHLQARKLANAYRRLKIANEKRAKSIRAK
jgi:hypothetical protein